MCSSTSSEGPRLVRFAVPCAQTSVAIEMHSRTNGAKCHVFQEACSAGHRASSEAERRGLFFVVHSLVVDSTEQGRCHCSGEFEQLLLTCIVGCGLQSNTNRFNVRAAAAGMHTVLTIDIPYSGKLSREKTFTNFAIFQPSTKVFSMKF